MSMVNKWYPWFEGHAPRAALFSIGTNPPDTPNQAKSIAQIGGPVRQSAHPQHQNNTFTTIDLGETNLLFSYVRVQVLLRRLEISFTSRHYKAD